VTAPAWPLPQRIIICAGSGGVGKTTTAAALASAAAAAGVRALVITIDPARRLAEALGIDGLDDTPRRVYQDGTGELWAAMLEPARVFDRLIERLTPDAARRSAILGSPFYRELSTALAGSRELVAMERVLELADDPRFQLIVLDTPPAQHALDFLEAPARVVALLDGRLMGLFMRAQTFTPFALLRDSSTLVLRVIERLAGGRLFADLADFLQAFSAVFEGFRARSARVQALIRSPATGFLLVTSPSEQGLAQATRFAGYLRTEGYGIVGCVANAVLDRPAVAAPLSELTAAEIEHLHALTEVPDALARITALWASLWARYTAEQQIVSALGALSIPVLQVPRLPLQGVPRADLAAFAQVLGAHLAQAFRGDVSGAESPAS
jgi:anion-transporting  ArsA/GET3 family ATPase